MTLHREGTLLRDSLGYLWMILGYYNIPPKIQYYDIIRLKCGYRHAKFIRFAHSDFEVVSEV